MYVTGHRLASSHPTLIRVQNIAAPAAQLVEHKLGGRVGSVDVVVAPRSAIAGLIVDAHRGLFGRNQRCQGRTLRCYGTTTISPAGVLVIINADKCRRDTQTDATLIHELVHAVQFGRPGARDAVIRGLRNNYGIDVMTDAEAAKANRQVDRNEDEAEALERLARKLARVTA